MAITLTAASNGLQCMGSASAPCGVVQSAQGSGVGATSVTATFAAAQTSNNTNVVLVQCSIAGDISSVVDSSGNTYTAIPLASVTNGLYNLYAYACRGAIAAAGAGANTVTVNFSASVTAFVAIVEAINVAGFDTNVATGTGTTTGSTITYQCQYGNAVVLCAAVGDALTAPTAGTGFTALQTGAITGASFIVEQAPQATIAAVTAAATGVAATTWSSLAIGLFPPSGPPSFVGNTVCFFFKYTSASALLTLFQCCSNDSSGASYDGWTIAINQSAANRAAFMSGNFFGSSFGETMAVGNWYFCAVVVANAGTNGILTFLKKVGAPVCTAAMQTATGPFNGTPGALCVGNLFVPRQNNTAPGTTNAMIGTMAGLRFWTRALTQAEIERESETIYPHWSNYGDLFLIMSLTNQNTWADESGESNLAFAPFGGTGALVTADDPPINRYPLMRQILKRSSGGLTIAAAGINSAEAIGPAALAVALGGAGVGSDEVIGAATFARVLAPGGIDSAEALGQETLSLAATLAGVPSAEVVGQESATITLGGAGVPSAEVVGPPSGVSPALAPAGVPSSEGVGAESLAAALTSAGIASAESIGQESLATALMGGGIASAEAIGAETLSTAVGGAGVSSSEVIGAPAGVSPVLGPAGVSSAEVIGQEALSAILAPAGVASSEVVGEETLSTVLGGAGIASSESVGEETLAALLQPSGLASDESVGEEIVATLIGVASAGIGSAEAIGEETLSLAGYLAGVASAEGVGEAALLASLGLVGITSDEAIGETILSQEHTIFAAGIDTAESVGQEIVTGGKPPVPPTPPPTPTPAPYHPPQGGGGGGGGSGLPWAVPTREWCPPAAPETTDPLAPGGWVAPRVFREDSSAEGAEGAEADYAILPVGDGAAIRAMVDGIVTYRLGPTGDLRAVLEGRDGRRYVYAGVATPASRAVRAGEVIGHTARRESTAAASWGMGPGTGTGTGTPGQSAPAPAPAPAQLGAAPAEVSAVSGIPGAIAPAPAAAVPVPAPAPVPPPASPSPVVWATAPTPNYGAMLFGAALLAAGIAVGYVVFSKKKERDPPARRRARPKAKAKAKRTRKR